jgi:hypothetical protein
VSIGQHSAGTVPHRHDTQSRGRKSSTSIGSKTGHSNVDVDNADASVNNKGRPPQSPREQYDDNDNGAAIDTDDAEVCTCYDKHAGAC